MNRNPWIHIPILPEILNVRSHGPDKIIKTLQNMAIRSITDTKLLEDASEAFFEASDRLYPLQIFKGLDSFCKLRYSNEAILSSVIGRIEDLLPAKPPSAKRILDLLTLFARLNICHPMAIEPLISCLKAKAHDIGNELSFGLASLSQLLIHDEKLLNLLATQAILTQKNHHLYSTFESFTRHKIKNDELIHAVTSHMHSNKDISIKSKIKLLSAFSRLGIRDFDNYKDDIEKHICHNPMSLPQISIWLNFYRLSVNNLNAKLSLTPDLSLPFQLLLLLQIVDKSHKFALMQEIQRLNNIINDFPTPTNVLQSLQFCIFSEIKWVNEGIFTDDDREILSNVCNKLLEILNYWIGALNMSQQRTLLDLLLYLNSSSTLNVSLDKFTEDASVPPLLPLFPQKLKFEDMDIVQIGSRGYMSNGQTIHIYRTERDKFTTIGGIASQLSLSHLVRIKHINSLSNYTLLEEST